MKTWQLFWYYYQRIIAADANDDEELVLLCFDECHKIAPTITEHVVDELIHNIDLHIHKTAYSVMVRRKITYCSLRK